MIDFCPIIKSGGWEFDVIWILSKTSCYVNCFPFEIQYWQERQNFTTAGNLTVKLTTAQASKEIIIYNCKRIGNLLLMLT